MSTNRSETGNYVRDLRRLVGTCPVNLVGAAGLFQDERGELLLLRRVGADCWGLPTGISELGEALEDTLKRETLEETGLTVHSAELLEILSPTGLSEVANGEQFYSYTALFRVTEWSGGFVPDGVEIAEARFFAPGDLPPLTRLGRKAQEGLT